MSIVAFRPISASSTELTDAAFMLQSRPSEDIPWWAIELLDLPLNSDLARCRYLLRIGRPRGARMWNLFAELIALAEQRVMTKSIEEWRDLAYNDADGKIANIVRDAALFNPRAFVKFCDIRDHEGEAVDPADFHLDMIAAMRKSDRPALIECFWGGGKSWNSSVLVPLMDWAEEPRATEGRIYLDEDTVKFWTGKLMQIVEENDSLHKLFPWIRKPLRTDPAFKIWGLEGFAIGGNPTKVRSFEGHTIGASKTGFRFWRTGIDDIVSIDNKDTPSVQERHVSYIKTVALTMRQRTRRPTSRYGTVFPGFYTVGTPYARGDANVQLKAEYKQKGYKVVSIPIFINSRKPEERPRWAAVHTPEALARMREEMTDRPFNMRCRLELDGLEHAMFPEAEVDIALRDGRTEHERFLWCVVPPNMPLMIGLDPGSGNKPTHHGARYPAWAVYGARDRSRYQAQHPSALLRDYGDNPTAVMQQHDIEHHVVQWGRMGGYGFTKQCETVISLARFYGCPIAVEDNGVQSVWAQEIAKMASDVRVISHTTGANKRDPNQGVDQFEPILHNQRLMIHADNAPSDMVKAIREEFVAWRGSTEKSTGFSDILMALWIARHQFNLHIQINSAPRVTQRQMPAHVLRFTRGR